MCFEGKWLQNQLRGDKNESISLLAVDILGHQRGGFCIKLIRSFILDLSGDSQLDSFQRGGDQ